MKKVTVLLSTYNGGQWVREQIDSILAQTYADITIFARDDGSADNTPQILKEYEAAGQITLELGENIGFARSFHWLLSNAPECDYYSFADQDDVWFPDKIERAVAALNKSASTQTTAIDSNLPAIYFSNFDLYDKDLNFISHQKPLRRGLHFLRILCSHTVYGFTAVINNALRGLFLKTPPQELVCHDHLAVMIASAFGGRIIYDSKPSVKCRRHDDNISVTGAGFIRLNIWRVKNILINDKFELKQQWLTFYDVYSDMLDDDSRNKLSWFTHKRYHFGYALRKAFYPKRYRESLFDELALRVLFLAGRF